MRAWLVGEYEAVLFEEDSGPVGHALFLRETDYFYLRQFFICPEHRRQGRGRAALDWLRTDRWQDLSRVRLDVLVGNAVGQAFWRSVGFQDYCLTMEWRR
ncbi:MAG TPA: GNAT family N-acetyltransferase [Planctomycetaceae bacterium]|nr:GNAT family N-acetyltransferase [Planctomycetaceae bacterium]